MNTNCWCDCVGIEMCKAECTKSKDDFCVSEGTGMALTSRAELLFLTRIQFFFLNKDISITLNIKSL
jgi:hypothetical protein